MTALNLKSLVGRLSPTCRRALEGAAGLCLSRSNYNVEIEHWLAKILEANNTDVEMICRHFEVNPTQLITDLTKAMDRLKTGNARPPALSQTVVDLARDAWLIASVDFGLSQARTGHLLLAMLSEDGLRRMAMASSEELDKIAVETLRKNYNDICDGSSEETETPATAGPAGHAPGRPPGSGKTPSLDQYCIDLTERARRGEIDPVLGRDDEIRQITDILCRRRQNNPILTGEAGVGKTAVVEGFAIRIAEGDVPPALQSVSLRSLDLALLQAGAGVKGEFENRLKSVMEEVKSSPTPIILFIDEAHTMIGAGGQAGQGDAANLLKPALARGELRTIAATTWAEYKKYFERDAALARRFQVVNVLEPDVNSAIEMMRGLVATLEAHHKVYIMNEAVEDAVKLSSRYITGRQLPDKAVSLLDTTCARINLSQNSKPPAVEDCERRIQQYNVAMDILVRESVAGVDHSTKVGEIQAECTAAETELEALQTRWQQEKELVTDILSLRQRLSGVAPLDDPAAEKAAAGDGKKKEKAEKKKAAPPAPLSEADRAKIESELEEKQTSLSTLQGEAPLVHAYCEANAVAETVAAWTGIPVGRMVADEINTILNLKDLMEESVVGQSHGMEQIAESIQTSRAKLTDPSRPIGIFLLAGTSGVGKTETAITLANLLYGGEQNLTTINMSEFKEEHKVSLLMGSPPGYIGYGEGGVLTEAVRRKPYSVLLLDEMEKAHSGVQDVFYQVFDKGNMKDGEGRDIDFKNTVIIMTSNAGTDLIMSLCSDPDTMPDAEGLAEALHPELLKTFKPAFLGRVSVIPYFPLSDEIMKKIIRLKLNKVQRRVKENYNADMTYTDELVDEIASRCTEVDTGARNVDKILNRTMLPELSTEFLSFMAAGREIGGINVTVGDGGFVYELKEHVKA
jgi:type VI secretion system protein VasG